MEWVPEEEGEEEVGSHVREPAEIARDFQEDDPRWKSGTAIELGDGSTWQPDLVLDDGSALLHVHVAERLRSYATRRFAQAVEAGIEVHVVTPLGHLYEPELLEQLAAVDARVHLLGKSADEGPKRALALLADQGIKVPPGLRTTLGRHGLDFAARDGTPSEKGKRFEALVAFLLSQVEGFSIFERNYRTSTEEIDVVLQQRQLNGRVWALANAPFLLVEAKNHEDGISQGMFSQFRIKMMTKRSSVRIGLMLSRTTVSGAAKEQEEKFASEDLTIAFLDGEAITEWIDAPDGTEHLERVISRAMLGVGL